MVSPTIFPPLGFAVIVILRPDGKVSVTVTSPPGLVGAHVDASVYEEVIVYTMDPPISIWEGPPVLFTVKFGVFAGVSNVLSSTGGKNN